MALYEPKVHWRAPEDHTNFAWVARLRYVTPCGLPHNKVLTTDLLPEVTCKRCIRLGGLRDRYAQSVGAIP